MKITTRISLGLGLLTVLMIAALGYQLSLLQKLQTINRDLSRTNLEAARISVSLLQGVEGVREFGAKALVLGDPDYFEQWGAWEGAVEQDLERLRALGLAGEEEYQRLLLQEWWQTYLDAVVPLRPEAGPAEASSPLGSSLPLEPSRALPLPAAGEDLDLLDRLEIPLAGLRESIEGLIALNESAVAERAATAAGAAERAQWVSWSAAGGAVLLGALIALFLYLSISGPLRALTRGTRELARGRFEHRLGVRGSSELAALADDFNDMAAHLGELEDLKRDFLSHVSHELKGPLAAIHETILILLEEIPGPLSEKQHQFLELSRQSANRLSAMISNLLEVSRLEAGSGEYRPDHHDLTGIIRSVLYEMEPLAADRELRLSLVARVGSAVAVCDGDRVREVVANLVGNAVKFSPDNGRIRVTLTHAETPPASMPEHWLDDLSGERGPFLLLSVEDEGEGIPPEHREGVFEKFHQVKRDGRIQGQGVGLGLSISRRIVEAHGGAIWVDDREDPGAAFRVLLPRVPSRWRELDARRRAAEPGASENGRSGRLVRANVEEAEEEAPRPAASGAGETVRRGAEYRR